MIKRNSIGFTNLLILVCTALVAQGQHNYYGGNSLLPFCIENTSDVTSRVVIPGGVTAEQSDGAISFKVSDHLRSERIIVDSRMSIKPACDYAPYGFVSDGGSGVDHMQYLYGATYNWDPATRLYSSPTRKYEPGSKRFLSADVYRQASSPYSYTFNNPVVYTDHNGEIIQLFVDGLEAPLKYEYEVSRSFPEVFPETLKDAMMTLDRLVGTNAMNINLAKENEPEQVVNVLDKLMTDPGFEIKIHASNTGKNIYNTMNETINYNTRNAVFFKKDVAKKVLSLNDIGLNSPVISLAHELIHAYHHKYDLEGMIERVASGDRAAEEALTIQRTNQVAGIFGEDLKYHHKGKHYRAKTSLTTEPEEDGAPPGRVTNIKAKRASNQRIRAALLVPYKIPDRDRRNYLRFRRGQSMEPDFPF